MNEPITEERLEKGLVLLAYLIKRDGPVYMPLFDRLERELIELRRMNESVEARTARLLGVPTHGIDNPADLPKDRPQTLVT